MFVALSRFTIRNDMSEAVRQAFKARPHRVDAAAGFVDMQVMSPLDNPAEIWLLTRWSDEQSFQAWHSSHAYHDSHAGIPKGLKLVPRSADVRCFHVFADQQEKSHEFRHTSSGCRRPATLRRAEGRGDRRGVGALPVRSRGAVPALR